MRVVSKMDTNRSHRESTEAREFSKFGARRVAFRGMYE